MRITASDDEDEDNDDEELADDFRSQHGSRARKLVEDRRSNVTASGLIIIIVRTALLLAMTLPLRRNSLAIRLTPQVDSDEYVEDYNQDDSVCSYDGSVMTDKNWFGYLANMTVMDAGHLMFEFRFPAEKCCPNILFYTEEQISGISTRINCWQREELLHPEVDQILSLTPSFPWSGCRLTRATGVAMYVCKSGRSLTTLSQVYPIAWYVAVSNCAAMYGLELTYHLEIHGQILSCPSSIPPKTMTEEFPRVTMMPSLHKAVSMIPRQVDQPFPENDQTICTVEGKINTTQNWVGFLYNFSFLQDGGFHYEISYPYDMYIQNLILYGEEQVVQLHGEQNCWTKERIIPAHQVPITILQLSFRADGCISKFQPHGDDNITCTGEQRFDKPQKVFLAVSNCRSTNGLLLYYKLRVFGFNNKDLCRDGNNHTMSLSYHFPLETCLAFLLLWSFNLLQNAL